MNPQPQRTVENILKLSDKITDHLVKNKIELDNTSLHSFIDLCEEYNFEPSELVDYQSKSTKIFPINGPFSLYQILISTRI
jgi:hypothetical protein